MYFFVKKRKMWRFSALLLGLLCLMHASPVYAADEPDLYATAAVLMDADTGRVLYSKEGDVFLSNASTTKILTCIITLENADLDEQVEVSAYAAGMPKVKLFMREGEHYRLGDLLYSLMLESHNDSAMAIAEHVGGSMEGFAEMMNEKAKDIGCENSWFITPNGLDATQTFTDEAGDSIEKSHGTTAEDLARIMAYCAFYSPASEEFLRITRTVSYSFSNAEGRSFTCANHNSFLNMMEGALTGKTGFTNKAGYCYVAAFEKDGRRFTLALLACGWPNNKSWKWADAKELFAYGMEQYVYHTLEESSYDPGILLPIPVENGQSDRIGGTVSVPLDTVQLSVGYVGMEALMGEEQNDAFSGLLLAPEEEITVTAQVESKLTAPVEAGTVVGSIRYMLGEDCLKELAIVTKESIAEIDFLWCFRKILEKYIL